MPPDTPTSPKLAKPTVRLGAALFSGVWAFALVLICVPLWLSGLVLMRLGHLCITSGYTVHDALGGVGDNLEQKLSKPS